jgi:cytoskeleton protein RodZ
MSDMDEHLNSQSDTRAQNGQSSDETPRDTSTDASSGAYSDRIPPDLMGLEVSDADPGKLDDESPGELFTSVGGASFPDSQTEKAPDEDAPLPAEEADSTAPSLFCQNQQSFPFEPLGEYLRRHREAAGITIDQLASTTKIKGRIISALEEDRYEDVPHTPIVRGFLKILAAEIGLGADDLLSRFRPIAQKAEEEADFIFSAQLTESRRALRTRIPVAALFLLVLGVGYYFYVEGWKLGPDQEKKPPGVKAVETVLRKARRPVASKVVNPAGPKASEARAAAEINRPKTDRIPTVSEAKSAVKVNKPKADRNPKTPEVRAEKKNGILPPSSGPDGDGRPTPAVAETIPKSGSPPSSDARAASAGVTVTEKVVDNAEVKVTLKKKTAPSPSQSPLVLNVTAKGDTWLRVIVDGKQRDEVFLLEGESRRWSGNKTFVLTIGNATSTVVELNGSSIPLPKTESNLVQDFLISKNDLP